MRNISNTISNNIQKISQYTLKLNQIKTTAEKYQPDLARCSYAANS